MDGLGKVLALPKGDGQEDGHHQGGEQLQVVGVQAQPQNDLDDHVVDDGPDDGGRSFREKLWKILLSSTCPMMTAASPMTMAPRRPMSMVALPWYWASKAPDRATRPLESIRPSTLVVSVLIPWARDMLELEPVARRAQPSSVPKN